MPVEVGFIGFGEAGYHLARGLRRAVNLPLVAFDIQASHDSAAGRRIRERARETGTQLVDRPADLAAAASLILSVVTAASAAEAAQSVARHLTNVHLYVDLNSVSPASKQQVATIVEQGSGRFVEGSIMAPVPGPEHAVPILLNGRDAAAVAAALSPYGMNFDVLAGAIGTAAAVKMCRSIVVKGLEALLLECTLAAREYDAADRVFDSLAETYPGIDWRQTATYMIGRVLQHGERRAREMEEVASTLRAAGIDPLMTEATVRRQDWEATLRHAGRLTAGERPDHVEALLALLVTRPAKPPV